ncbi:hypothetical protein C8A01DRAFT_47274 [Parachaetomium inaequale]|uniref:Uncharacterized protein n=1 Tax=Parachaetomium inaequale TaxID=2588326 RepID=A0AAN6PFK4_9PEZI|nr:hypothetical protein C8A01DRAFT_47274 [Parachaetomium inaequale]
MVLNRHALALTAAMATARAAAPSPPEKRQAAITVVSTCHMHCTRLYCMVGATEYVLADAAVTPATTTAPSDAASTSVTAVTDCHLHDTQYKVSTTATATADLPLMYAGCHSHDSDTYCLSPSGNDVQIQLASEEDEGDASEPVEENCHFHANVEHCVGGSGESGTCSCERTDREYNVPLRIGLLFTILVTSVCPPFCVFAPIVLAKFLSSRANTALLIIKQFGPGVLMSTSLVHLFTHAELMFGSECLGELQYEATTAAILMAGLFLSFLIEYLGYRFVERQARKAAAAQGMQGGMVPVQNLKSLEMVSVYVMEAGVIFYSLIIGLTLVVASDSFLLTLFIGLVLGSRIAALGTGSNSSFSVLGHSHASPSIDISSSGKTTGDEDNMPGTRPEDAPAEGKVLFHVPMAKKMCLAGAFALVTPVSMAIGIGVLDVLHGNDPQTIVAVGVLDAFSAGILLWAAGWVYGGGLADASAVATCLGLGGLVAGMVMSVLGKWA